MVLNRGGWVRGRVRAALFWALYGGAEASGSSMKDGFCSFVGAAFGGADPAR